MKSNPWRVAWVSFAVVLVLFTHPASAQGRRQVELVPGWTYGLFGQGTGWAGILTADVNGDQVPEVITTCNGGTVALRRVGSEYRPLWFGEKLNVAALALASGSSRPGAVFYGASTDGHVYAFEAATGVRLASATVAAGSYSSTAAIAAGDVDGDGSVEVIFTNDLATYVLDGVTLAAEWTATGKGGSGVGIGDIDADGKVEVVVNSGTGHVLDAYARREKWAWAGGFGSRFCLGDADGDGWPEIVYCKDGDGIYVFDGTSLTDLKKVSLSNYYSGCSSLIMGDIDGNGSQEIIAALPYYDGGIYAYRGTDGGQVGRFTWSEGVYGLALWDMDGDGDGDLIWGDSTSSDQGKGLIVGDWASGTVLWRSQGLFPPLSTVANDIDGDGIVEVLTFSLAGEGDYDRKGLITCIDPRTQAVEWTLPDIQTTSYGYTSLLGVGQLDGDGPKEIALSTGDSSAPIRVYDASTRTLQWTAPPSNDGDLRSMAVADFDGDGVDEIVAAYYYEVVTAYHGASNLIQWQTSELDSNPLQVAVADIYGDGSSEIAVLTVNNLYLFDPVGGTQSILAVQGAQAFGFVPAHSRSGLDILVARSTYYYGETLLDCYNKDTHSLIWSTSLGDQVTVGKILSSDLDGDGDVEIVIAGGSGDSYYASQRQSFVRIGSVLGSSGCWMECEGVGDYGGYLDAALANLSGDAGPELLLTATSLFHVDQVVSNSVACSMECTASATPTSGILPLSVNFAVTVNATACGSTPSFLWDFGDGATSQTEAPEHQYMTAGTFSWSVTVTLEGVTCTQSGAVTVQPACQLTCTASAEPAAGVKPLAVHFHGEAVATDCSGTPTFSWAFGDGSTFLGADITHTYTGAGTFAWTLTVSGGGKTCQKTGTVTVQQGIPGDCDDSGQVSIGEVQKAINMFLGILPVACGVDCNGDGQVSIGEVQKVINVFLGVATGC